MNIRQSWTVIEMCCPEMLLHFMGEDKGERKKVVNKRVPKYLVMFHIYVCACMCVCEQGFQEPVLDEFFFIYFLLCASSGTDMLSKLLKMQVLEDDEELAYGGEDTPGTERKDIEVRFPSHITRYILISTHLWK